MANPILTDPADHVTWDTINSLNYSALLAAATANSTPEVVTCLAPVCGNDRQVDERKKAAVVQYYLNQLGIGTPAATVFATNLCDCAGYDCSCTPGSSQTS